MRVGVFIFALSGIVDLSVRPDYMLCKRKQFSEKRQLEFCPHCGVRLVPTPQEIKLLRQFAGLSQRMMADRLCVKASHVAYLERGSRKPSGSLILRYRKLEKRLLAKVKADSVERANFIEERARRSLQRARDAIPRA